MNSKLKKQINKLPRSPGVYFFKDQTGQILYIGKAISLRDRVRSYASSRLGEERGYQLIEMVNKAKTVEIKKTSHELLALLIEAKLIRQYKPPYNIRLRDDKSFAVIAIDSTLDYPQITIKREVDIERICLKLKRGRSLAISQKIAKIEYFGPYPSTSSTKRATQSLRRAFKFRDCSPEKFHRYQKIGRGCLFASINLCDAPCVGNILESNYNWSINNIREFLRGNRTKVIRDLEVEMKRQTKNENFERAALLRDQIFALSKIQMQAKISVRVEYIQPRRSGKKKEERRKNKVRLLRIEAFDVSNISGEFAVGAMVVGFLNPIGNADLRSVHTKNQIQFAKQFYRRFKIRTIQGANDIAMMQEVLMRRFRHLVGANGRSPLQADWIRPDLIIIDGGRAHLNMANKIQGWVGHAQPVQKILIIAVAKGPSRKKVDLYYNKKIQIFINQSELPKIAEKMREEAHRFAIGYYRTLHRRQVVGKK